MFIIPGPSPDITLRFVVPHERGFNESDLRQVVDGIAAEDMRIVTAPELSMSYSAIGAFDTSNPASEKIVGFVRQAQRDDMYTSIGELCVGEVGSVWVDPAYRGQRIGSALIGYMTNLMSNFNFVSLAVCNQYSRNSFEAKHYTPIGKMPTTAEGNERIVELYENHTDWSLELRNEVLRGLQQLPRFSQMTLLDEETLTMF